MNGVIAVMNKEACTSTVIGVVGNTITTNGGYTFTVALNKGVGTPQIANTLTLIITSATNDLAQDNQDIATAKGIIENMTYIEDQVNAGNIGQAKAVVEDIIGGRNLIGVTVTVSDCAFTPAIEGTADGVNGIDGSYIFTVALTKGLGTQKKTAELTLTITATPYDQIHDISADDRIIITARSSMTTNHPIFKLSAKEAIFGNLIVAAYDANDRLINIASHAFDMNAGDNAIVDASIPYTAELLYRFFIFDGDYMPLTYITSVDDF